MIDNLFFSFKKKTRPWFHTPWNAVEMSRRWTLTSYTVWQKQDGAEFYLFLILELHVSSYDMYKLSFSRCI